MSQRIIPDNSNTSAKLQSLKSGNRGTYDNSLISEEGDEVKVSRPVLKMSGNREYLYEFNKNHSENTKSIGVIPSIILKAVTGELIQ